MKTPWIKSFWNEIQTCRNTISPLSNNSQWFIYYWRSKIALFAHLKFLTKILLVKVSSFFIMITNTVEIFWTLRKLEIWTKMGFHVPIKTQKLFMIQMILNWKAYSLIIWSIYCLMKFLLTFFLMEPGIYLQNIKKWVKPILPRIAQKSGLWNIPQIYFWTHPGWSWNGDLGLLFYFNKKSLFMLLS